MADFIERGDAFDAVMGQYCASSDETEAALNGAIEDIREIPAADVRPVIYDAVIKRALRYYSDHLEDELLEMVEHGESENIDWMENEIGLAQSAMREVSHDPS